MNKCYLFILVLFLLLSTNTYAQEERINQTSPQAGLNISALTTSAEMDSFILATMEQHHVPGVAVCIVRNGKLIWKGTYGYANIAKNLDFSYITDYLYSYSEIIFHARHDSYRRRCCAYMESLD